MYGDTFSINVQQILMGSFLKKGPRQFQVNMAKALLAELWFDFSFKEIRGYSTTKKQIG